MANIRELNDSLADENNALGLYIGVVLANNDPQDEGRVRVQVYGVDDGGLSIDRYRWMSSVQSLSGVQLNAMFGPNKTLTEGFTAYGTVGVHRLGTLVLVAYIEGNLNLPIIIGAVAQTDLTNSLPMGKNGQNELADTENKNIQPLVDNLITAFGVKDTDVKHTRGYEVSARAESIRNGVPDVPQGLLKNGDVGDDRLIHGAPKSINNVYPEGNQNEPTMYSFTTPGQHSLLFNDDPDNCRIRVKTVSGQQIILDDTNERIYISTAKGENYIEFDNDGHIDVFAGHRISIHSEQDINIKSDKQVNIEGIEGVNIVSGKDMKVECRESINVKADNNIFITAKNNAHVITENGYFGVMSGDNINITNKGDITFETDGAFGVTTKKTIDFTSKQDININSGDDILMKATKSIEMKAQNKLIQQATVTQINSVPPRSPNNAKLIDDEIIPAIGANKVNRTPLHERNEWRNIDTLGNRSDAAKKAHVDQEPTNVYKDIAAGGKNIIKRLVNWRK